MTRAVACIPGDQLYYRSLFYPGSKSRVQIWSFMLRNLHIDTHSFYRDVLIGFLRLGCIWLSFPVHLYSLGSSSDIYAWFPIHTLETKKKKRIHFSDIPRVHLFQSVLVLCQYSWTCFRFLYKKIKTGISRWIEDEWKLISFLFLGLYCYLSIGPLKKLRW